MRKRERLDLIKKIILAHEVETQFQLLEYLEQEGVHLTQATVSRYLNEVGIIKIPSKSGQYIYGLPQHKRQVAPSTLESISIAKNIRFISRLENMVNIAVIPGSGHMVKRYLFSAYKDQIFSIVADDDSILIITPTNATAELLEKQIKDLT